MGFDEDFAGEVLACLKDLDGLVDVSAMKEDAWSAAIRDHFLAPHGALHAPTATITRRYPGQTKKYDVLLPFQTGEVIYVETKGAWKTWWRLYGGGGLGTYRAWLFSPLGGVRGKNDSAALDLKKLATLTPADATHVGLVLLGSAMPVDDIAADFERLRTLAKVVEEPWSEFKIAWPNPHAPGYAYDLRVWICRRSQLADWWSRAQGSFA